MGAVAVTLAIIAAPWLGWVALHAPDGHDFSGTTLEEALAWCLVWLVAPELGIGPFLA